LSIKEIDQKLKTIKSKKLKNFIVTTREINSNQNSKYLNNLNFKNENENNKSNKKLNSNKILYSNKKPNLDQQIKTINKDFDKSRSVSPMLLKTKAGNLNNLIISDNHSKDKKDKKYIIGNHNDNKSTLVDKENKQE